MSETPDTGAYVPERLCYLTSADLWALRRAVEPIYAAHGRLPYLVGSSLTRRDWRDVDVRLPMDDDTFADRYPSSELGHARWTLDCISIGAMLRAATGLPIDFQPQPLSIFESHDGLRQPLLSIAAYAGGPPALTAPSAPETRDA